METYSDCIKENLNPTELNIIPSSNKRTIDRNNSVDGVDSGGGRYCVVGCGLDLEFSKVRYVDSSKQQQKDVWGFCGDNCYETANWIFAAIIAMKLRN